MLHCAICSALQLQEDMISSGRYLVMIRSVWTLIASDMMLLKEADGMHSNSSERLEYKQGVPYLYQGVTGRLHQRGVESTAHSEHGTFDSPSCHC